MIRELILLGALFLILAIASIPRKIEQRQQRARRRHEWHEFEEWVRERTEASKPLGAATQMGTKTDKA